VIVNCGALGLDWERASLSAYLEAMEAHGAAAEQAAGDDLSDLQRFMEAHALR
jgi:hypothetical protein